MALVMLTVLFVSVSCGEKDPPAPSTYKVTFDTGDGTAVDPVNVNPGETVARPKKNPTNAGYTFINWFSDKECTQKYDFSAAVNSNITIYAKWVDNTTYEHSDPILPNGTGAKIPTDWSEDERGTLGEGLPDIIYNFNGYVKDPDTGKYTFVPVAETNVTEELIAAVKAANADPDYFDDTPTNVLFVFSDGWGVTSVDMSREYKGELIMDYLPFYTQSKTDSYIKYSHDGNNDDYTSKTTTDSPAGGTQVLAGYKTRYGYIALDVDGNIIPNLSDAARSQDWVVACVTNDNIVDATPAVSIMHDTNRYHSDVLYYKALMATTWDLLMGWDWGMGTYFIGDSGSWADRLLDAAKEGIKDANSREKTGSLPEGKTPIEFFKSLDKASKAKVAPFLIYYALWENEDLDKRLNSWQRWTRGGDAELQAFLTWLDSPQGLTKKIAELDAQYGKPEAHVAGRFTTFKNLVANTDFTKPVLGSWTTDGADYEAATPNRGYMIHGTIGANYPSWPEMVAYTIYQMDAMADEANTGFFAMIENTCTDGWGHSGNYDTKYKGQMNEVQCFDEGVAIAVKYVLEHPDTLLVITADHETGGYTLRDGWEKDITKIKSTTTGHSSQNVPLYAFGAGADRFSAESILEQYGQQENAGVTQGGFVHEGWITGAILGQLITGEDFGETANYKGK